MHWFIHLVFFLLLIFNSCDLARQFDLVIRNGIIVDGKENKRYKGDLAIIGNKIAVIGEVKGTGRNEIDVSGKIVAPGFIDTHSHHDLNMLDDTGMLAAVSQGITTIFIGQDGFSEYPISDLIQKLQQTPVAVNIASFSGHNTLRKKVMGLDYKRVATEKFRL